RDLPLKWMHYLKPGHQYTVPHPLPDNLLDLLPADSRPDISRPETLPLDFEERKIVLDQSAQIIATDRELIFLDAKGTIVGTFANGAISLEEFPSPERQRAIIRREEARQRILNDRTEDVIIETYLKHSNVTGYNAREAMATWDLYKKLTQNKSLKEATRDDGRKVVEFFANPGVKSATIK